MSELPYFVFTVSLNICSGCCNTLNDLSHKIYLPNITEVVNVKVLSVMAEKNEPKYEENISHMIVNLDLGVKISRIIKDNKTNNFFFFILKHNNEYYFDK